MVGVSVKFSWFALKGGFQRNGVFQGPVRTHRRVPEAEFQGLRFLAIPVIFCQEDCFSGLLEFFYGFSVFSKFLFLSSVDFLNWYSIF